MKFFFHLCLLALVALATGMPLSSPLNVTLTSTGASNMQITVKNVGKSDVALVTAGSLFDTHPVQKVTMHSGSTALVFRGTIVDPKPITALVSTDFTKLHAGQSSSVQFDAAEMYDLSSGGTFTAEAAGYIWDAESFGFISYKSNPVKITVGEVETAMVERRDEPDDELLEESTKIRWDSCTDSQQKFVQKALEGCYLYADAGAHATWNKTAEHFFKKHFGSTEKKYKKSVHSRLIKISKECISLYDSAVNITCTDWKDGSCLAGNLGYRRFQKGGRGTITLCPSAFDYDAIDDSSKVNDSCHSMDIAGFLLAQHAFFSTVYNPATLLDNEDYDATLKMQTTLALSNATTYRYFSKAAYLDCQAL